MKPSIRIIIPLALVCFALTPRVHATCEEGCLTNSNTALGEDALLNNTTGTNNTAVGFNALSSNSDGGYNTATGNFALYNNTTGPDNTATGVYALYFNTTGGDNTATGDFALYSNTTGGFNTATGHNALYTNTDGSFNTASGNSSLSTNTSGTQNVAMGNSALQFNTTGSNNTAIGPGALQLNTTGNTNIALGAGAGLNITGNSNIDIGHVGVAGESRTIRVGTRTTHRNTFIAGISGATVPTGIAVVVDANGHLGTTTSSARYKVDIQPMAKSSNAILSLKPVTFHYKKDLDPEAIPQFGLVAEDVAKIDPDLVAKDEEGKPYAVRYQAVNAMLLNEFLNEHKKVKEQADEIAGLKSALKEQSKQIQDLAARFEANDL